MKKTVKTAAAIAALSIVCLSAAGCKDAKYSAYDSSEERYDYYLPDYVDVCEYTGIEVPDLTYTPTEEDVDNYIMNSVATFCTFEKAKDRPCKRGDIVDIITTCTFKESGKKYAYFDFKKNSNGFGQSFTLGANTFGFPALEEAVEGMTQGETKTVTLTLPDPFYKDYMNSGKEIEIEIYLNYVDEIHYDEADDDFYLEFFEYSKEDFREVAKDKLTSEYNSMIEGYREKLTWQYIYDNSKLIKVPEDEYNEIYDSALADARKTATENDQTLLEYVESIGYETLDDYYSFLEDFAEDCCYEDMLMYYIIRCENLNYDDDYYSEQLLKMVSDYQITDAEEAESFLEYYYGLDAVREEIRFQYAKEWIADKAKVLEDKHTVY